MAGRNLGEAFVVISPDADGFLGQLVAKVTAAVKSFRAPPVTVPVAADTKTAEAQVAALAGRMKTLLATVSQMHLDADDKALQAKLLAIAAKTGMISKQLSSLVMKADTSALDAKIAAETAALAKLRQQASDLQLDLNAAQAAAKVAALIKQIRDLDASLEDLTAEVDIDAALTKIYALEAELRVLDSDAKATEIGARTAAFDAAIAASEAKIMTLKQQASDIQLGGLDPAKLLAMNAAVTGLEASVEKLGTTGTKTANTPIFTAGWINGQIMGFANWHIVLDALIEGLIVTATTLAALGAAAAVAAPAIDQVSYSTEHALQVMTALGVDSGPLAGKLDAVQKAMAPQVIEAYGGALSVLTGQTGALSKAGTTVVTMFDDWIARIDIWAKGQNDMGGLLKSGIGYLGQLMGILGTLGQAVDNLLQKDPGVAHFLLDLVQGAASAINIFSKLPAPLVEATLALHGFYLWTKVLVVGPILAMASSLGIMSDEQAAAAKSALTLKGAWTALFVDSPVGWLVAAGAGLTLLALQGNRAGQSVRTFDSNLEAGLTSMSASQAATVGLAQAIGSLHDEMAGVSPTEILSGWHGTAGIFSKAGDEVQYFGHELGQVTQGSTLHELGALGDAIKSIFSPGFSAQGASTVEYQHDIASLNDELNKLTGSYRTLYGEAGNLMKSGFSLAQSFALMDAAGVKWNDSATLMAQKVANLISGYKDMGVQGGMLTNSLAAMNFATEQQDSKVTALNTAWDTFFKTVSGGATGFNAFATQSMGLYTSMAQGADKFTISNGKASISLQATTAAAQKGAPSINGLTLADLQLRDSFVQTASAASTQMDNLTLMSSAAGEGAKGTAMLTQASKDMVAQMLPAAKGSQEMTAILYTLAERGGYQGADSFQALAKWVGNTKDPMASLDKITTQLTVDSANLIKDVQNLSVALGQTLNTAMATAIFTASGGQKTFDNFAMAVQTSSGSVSAMQPTANTLINQLIALTGNTTDAKNEFITFAHNGLNVSMAAATALWNNYKGTGVPATQQLAANAVTAQQKFEQWAGKSGATGLGLTTLQAQNLWKQLSGDLGPYINNTLANSVLSTKDKFEQWAGKGGASGLGLTMAQAGSLYTQLKTLQGYINTMHGTNLPISVGLSAEGGMELRASGPVGELEKIEFAALAGGGRLPGFGGGDMLPALLERGEAVVDKDTTRKFASVLKAMGVPGFAAGGVAGLTGGLKAANTAAGSDVESVATASVNAELTATMNHVTAAAKAAMAAQAAAMSGGISGAGVSNASAEMALASAANKMGWGGSQWAALFDVEMREAGFSLTAQNPTSGAYGMAQFINGPSEYAQYGGNANTAAGQAVAMVNYIAQRYGSPQAAWAHELAYGWYDRGGVLQPGYTLAYNGTGRPETLVPAAGSGAGVGGGRGASLDDVHQALLSLINVTGQQGSKFAGALNSTSASAGIRGSYSTRR